MIDHTRMHVMTVADLRKMLDILEKENVIKSSTQIWLSSDEEGNSEGPLVQFNFNTKAYNCGVEGTDRLILYPINA